jgi:hypothetical protein
MRRFISLLTIVVAFTTLGPTANSAEPLLLCEAWLTANSAECNKEAEAQWSRIVVRTCFGEGSTSAFIGQFSGSITAESHDGTRRSSFGVNRLIAPIQGCFEDSTGSTDSPPTTGSIAMHIEATGVGYYSVAIFVE